MAIDTKDLLPLSDTDPREINEHWWPGKEEGYACILVMANAMHGAPLGNPYKFVYHWFGPTDWPVPISEPFVASLQNLPWVLRRVDYDPLRDVAIYVREDAQAGE